MSRRQNWWQRLTNNVLSKEEIVGGIVVLGLLMIMISVAAKLS